MTWVTGRPQRDQEFLIPGFPEQDFAKFWDPEIFQDWISLKFLSRDLAKKTWCLLQKERNLDEKEKILCFDDRHMMIIIHMN